MTRRAVSLTSISARDWRRRVARARDPLRAFMHPLGANRAYDHLAHVALGETAALR